MTDTDSSKSETAILGGGCFWCIEAVYEQLDGVQRVISGYAGGEGDHPSYQDICTGNSGHAEVVKIEFDPAVISFSEILDVFWLAHDPTSLNRQGGDVGTQYRSVVFYTSDEQLAVARKSMAAFDGTLEDSVVTEVSPLEKFFPAEDYHQGYYQNNKEQNYCALVIRPKLKKLDLDN